MTAYARLRVVDYGPFREALLDLKPLTVIVGRNSTGKSLLAYTYTVLARTLNPFNLLACGGRRALEEPESVAREYIAQALPRFLGRSTSNLVRRGCRRAVLQLSSPLGSVEAEITVEEGVTRIRYEPSSIVTSIVKETLQSLPASTPKFMEAMRTIASELGLVEVLEPYYTPLLLPDSRAGVVKIISKLQPYAALVALKEHDPDLELMLYITTLAQSLEAGRVDLEVVTPLLQELGVQRIQQTSSEILVTLSTGVTHILPAAPSGVREALPIALTLASKTPTELVVEEPEAHLHPAAVRALARVIARAVNQGKRVLLTTHSDTLVAAINNLVTLYNNPQKAEKLGYTRQDLLDPAKLAAYTTTWRNQTVELKRLKVDETGMDEQEFTEVLEDLANERAEALSQTP